MGTALETRARAVRAFVLDVDGVLTDGGLYYGKGGETFKRFSARDGFAIVTAHELELPVAIVSGRLSPPLRARLRDLRVPDRLVFQGSRDKAADLGEIAGRLDLATDAMAFMGDDLPDLPALVRVGLAACPSDAAEEVRRACHLVCRASGGRGAVRELIETVLRLQGRWDGVVDGWTTDPRARRVPAIRRRAGS